ncbi:phage tail protein [Chromobacterium alticapitis]|nr:phage tail protein [Chromobacterium alticapitis]
MSQTTICIKPQLQFNLVGHEDAAASSDGKGAQFQMSAGCCGQEGSVAAQGVPSGAIMHFAMEKAPEGWLKADGKAYAKKDYSALFSAIGDVYREAKNTDDAMFNVPDLRGEFIRGWDDGRGVDPARKNGSLQKGTLVVANEYFSDNELYNISTNIGTGQAVAGTAAFGADAPDLAGYPGLELHYITGNKGVLGNYTSSVGAARPRNLAMLACIKI